MYSVLPTNETPPIPNLPDYAFGERLGVGTYGTVYKARLISSIQSRPSSALSSRPSSARPTSARLPNVIPQFFAIKCINRKILTKVTQELLINEIEILKKIKHKNIVEMYDFQWDENYIYIVMEYCSGGDLSMFIRSRQQLSEARARPFVQQIAKVLKFLYENQISHMDLKPGNILLTSIDRPILKVADFGVSQHIGPTGSHSIRGTPMYMAPEILSSNPYDNRVDLWSMGVILYECLFGRPPFSFQRIADLIDTIQSNIPIEIPNEPHISPECRNLLEGLLQRDPNERMSFTDFFQHPFLFTDLSPRITFADELLKKANDDEQSGDLQKALDYRVQALDEYVSIMRIDEDTNRQKMLRTIVKQEVTAAEDLKRRIKETIPNSGLTPPPPTTTSILTSTINQNELDLNNNKELSDAYQHCLNGNQLMKEFRFPQAYEEYETGLDVMLRIAKNETDQTKIKILREVILYYLNKAESAKQRSKTQQLDLAIEKIKQATATEKTTIDGSQNDETMNEDKKLHTVLQQTCCLQ